MRIHNSQAVKMPCVRACPHQSFSDQRWREALIPGMPPLLQAAACKLQSTLMLSVLNKFSSEVLCMNYGP